MLHRDPVLDDLFELLSEWAIDLDIEGKKGVYLFGSAVNENGVRFEAHNSDLDVILIVDWGVLDLAGRLVQLRRLKTKKEDIELALFRKLRRSGEVPIVSLVPITLFELKHAIHKDGNDRILVSTLAHDLLERTPVTSLNGEVERSSLPQEHRSALQFVQKMRAKALSIREWQRWANPGSPQR